MIPDSLIPLVASALIGYLLGSIPSGYIAVKAATGQDIRKIGSGRTGGTNVYRAAGRAAFFATILGDIGKGALGVILSRLLFGSSTQPIGVFALNDLAQLVAGFCALLGNNWSLYLRGRGGAGVMTATGTMLVIAPVPILLVAWFPVLLVRLTHIASIGSLTAAILFPLVFAILAYAGIEPVSHLLYVIVGGLLLVVVHRPNIERLMQGKERRIGEPAKKE